MNQVSLDDVFDEDTYVERRLVARHRIIGVFAVATDPFSNRGTDNYIVGAGAKISDLAEYVMEHMKHKRHLVIDADLPFKCAALPKSLRGKIGRNLAKQLIIDELLTMRDEEIVIYWLDGCWQAVQTLIDEYQQSREIRSQHYLKLEELRAARRVKDDKRPLHGMVRSHAKARGIAPGRSIGGYSYA